jgi:hypothetical protein
MTVSLAERESARLFTVALELPFVPGIRSLLVFPGLFGVPIYRVANPDTVHFIGKAHA